MTYNEQRTSVERGVAQPAPRDPPAESASRIVSQRDTTVYRPSGATVAGRVVVVVFGLIQALILARLVLLALDANRGNDIVAGVLSASKVFVAPFEGMFNVDALTSGGSVLDVAAVTALAAMTIIELLVLAIVRIPRRSEDV